MESRLYFLPFFLFFALSCTQIQKTTIDEIKLPKDELPRALDMFNKAFADGNLTVLDSMTLQNYLHTNGSSKAITKKDWFNYLQKRNQQLKSGNLQVLDYSLEEQKIAYYGATAIVTGKVKVVTKDSLGTSESQYRITNVWVYEDGSWKRAGFHDGKIK
ncbi:MAG: nuclear transport factor 2 family protein [Bacteroidota bacterium]